MNNLISSFNLSHLLTGDFNHQDKLDKIRFADISKGAAEPLHKGGEKRKGRKGRGEKEGERRGGEEKGKVDEGRERPDSGWGSDERGKTYIGRVVPMSTLFTTNIYASIVSH